MGDEPRKCAQRTCIACRRSVDKKSLVRFVRCPDGSVELDASGKAKGRGAYICASEKCFDEACHRHKLSQALKVSIDAEGYARLRQEFEGILNGAKAQ